MKNRRTIGVISGIVAAILAVAGVEVYRHETPRMLAPRAVDMSFGGFGTGLDIPAGWPQCTRGVPPTSGNLRAITAWINFYGPPGTIDGALYSDVAGVPGNLIVQSVTGAMVTDHMAISLDTPSTPIIGGTTYWLCLATNDTGGLRLLYAAQAGNGFVQAGPGFWSTFQNPVLQNREYYIQGIYNEVITPTGERQVVVGGGIL